MDEFSKIHKLEGIALPSPYSASEAETRALSIFERTVFVCQIPFIYKK